MRDFPDVQRELSLKRIIAGRLYSQYVSSSVAGKPSMAVERFEGSIPGSLTPAYVALLRGLEEWIARHPKLARWVRIEQPTEVGPDFIVRPHHVFTTSTDSYEDPELGIEAPPELEQMRDAARSALSAGPGELSPGRFAVVERLLTRSLLTPSFSTYLNGREGRFIVVVPGFDERDLREW